MACIQPGTRGGNVATNPKAYKKAHEEERTILTLILQVSPVSLNSLGSTHFNLWRFGRALRTNGKPHLSITQEATFYELPKDNVLPLSRSTVRWTILELARYQAPQHHNTGVHLTSKSMPEFFKSWMESWAYISSLFPKKRADVISMSRNGEISLRNFKVKKQIARHGKQGKI